MLADILGAVNAHSAVVDARASISQRGFFEAVLRQLAKGKFKEIEWDKAWGESIDSFCAGLRAIFDDPTGRPSSRSPRKTPAKGKAAAKSKSRSPTKKSSPRKGGAKKGVDNEIGEDAMDLDAEESDEPGAIVLVIDSAEHLRAHLADIVVPLTRLHEQARIDITTVFISSNSWTDTQPPFAASPDPYLMHVPPLDKESLVATLVLPYTAVSSTAAVDGPYSPILAPLFRRFTESMYATCHAFVRDADELAYITASTWPAFVQPIVEAWHARAERDGPFATPPSLHESTRQRLVRLTTHAFNAALDTLYPRTLSPSEFAAQHIAPLLADVLISFEGDDVPVTMPASPTKPRNRTQAQDDALTDELPRVAQFALVAAYIASFNPPRSDVRMFARTAEERGKRRKGGGAPKRSLVAKIPPRLSGSAPFPLDRLLALLGRLLEDHDAPVDDGALDVHEIARDQAEMDVGRVQTLGIISELATTRLLYRVGNVDKALDSPPMFKCGISHAVALALAKNVGVTLADYLWENT
ncbi:hypothetical protein AURDEDRAFT_170173 [Auricularia subglabra TFB-10046 SS5]|nr:hypothetical protein AURDEDRAFT_170173 [Auricularia subglabra TFB-10046 SS5]